MFKLSVFVTLVLIASVINASSQTCQSCGPECVTACGTRRFRTCCFNYLRRKRGPDAFKFSSLNLQDIKPEGEGKPRIPVFALDPELWSIMSNDYKPNYFEDTIENGLQTYDA